jgi:hypothetical protein
VRAAAHADDREQRGGQRGHAADHVADGAGMAEGVEGDILERVERQPW